MTFKLQGLRFAVEAVRADVEAVEIWRHRVAGGSAPVAQALAVERLTRARIDEKRRLEVEVQRQVLAATRAELEDLSADADRLRAALGEALRRAEDAEGRVRLLADDLRAARVLLAAAEERAGRAEQLVHVANEATNSTTSAGAA